MKLREIAKKLKMSPEGIRRIEMKALAKLKNQLVQTGHLWSTELKEANCKICQDSGWVLVRVEGPGNRPALSMPPGRRPAAQSRPCQHPAAFCRHRVEKLFPGQGKSLARPGQKTERQVHRRLPGREQRPAFPGRDRRGQNAPAVLHRQPADQGEKQSKWSTSTGTTWPGR